MDATRPEPPTIARRLLLDLDDGWLALARLRRRCRGLQHAAEHALARHPDPSPFLLVTPLGLVRRRALAAKLAEIGVAVVASEPVASWPLACSSLFLRGLDRDRLRVAQVFEALWERCFPDVLAERWLLASKDDHARLRAARPLLGLACPARAIEVITRTHELTATLPAWHVSEPGALARDAACLAAAGRFAPARALARAAIRRDSAAATRPRTPSLAAP